MEEIKSKRKSGKFTKVSGRKVIKAARAMVSVYRRLGPRASHTILRSLDFILRAVESWAELGARKDLANCAFLKETQPVRGERNIGNCQNKGER